MCCCARDVGKHMVESFEEKLKSSSALFFYFSRQQDPMTDHYNATGLTAYIYNKKNLRVVPLWTVDPQNNPDYEVCCYFVVCVDCVIVSL